MSPPRAVPSVQRKELRGTTVTVQNREITPIAGMVAIRWPGGYAARQTPRAVEVREHGRIRRIPIRDVTSRAILATILAELALGAIIWRVLDRRSRHRITSLVRTMRSKRSKRRAAWTR